MLEHKIVYREPGRFAGWPANYGMWHWGQEIVAIFTEGTYQFSTVSHARDKTKPFATLQARSLDGGSTWIVEPFPGFVPGGRPLSADEHVLPELGLAAYLADHPDALADCPGNIPFTHPDFALMCARTGLDTGTQSFFYTTIDRCRSWQGPYRLPRFGQTAVAARTDYEVEDDRSCLLFLTANKQDGDEGRVFCARTTDGGRHFNCVSFIGEEPGPNAFAIMPSHLRFADGHYLAAIRCRGENHGKAPDSSWIDVYSSEDNAQTWQYLNRPVVYRQKTGGSNPPSMVHFPDDRIGLIYGNRDHPSTICARISHDRGKSWGEEVVLRSTGGTGDMGYTRAVVLEDGTLVTVYYLNDQPDGAGERFIEAARWQP
ncbi:MAG: exo-alpha-sialidase [Anaerolineae bacterium]|nr:exo-alpha-sialidase [Anaerolineae bacterium]